MKDKQISRKAESASIPVLSPVLHVLAMPVLVFLRHDFGYLFLRPKSVFLAFIWAFVLYAAYSFYEPARWNANPYVSLFYAASSLLYLVHLVRAVVSQLGKAPHDQFAGCSYFEFLGLKELKLFLWLEPILVLGAALLLEVLRRGNSLSPLLGLIASAMILKEIINRWFELRKVKQQLDATADAEDTMTKVATEREAGTTGKAAIGGSSRKPRQRRERVRLVELDESELLETYAAALRMIAPYTLEQAESNFRSLVKQFHPDEAEQNPEVNAGLVKLTSARDFFRERFDET